MEGDVNLRAFTPVLALAIAGLASACSTGVVIGSKPGDVPPRIVDSKDGGRTWDNPAAFGPVPVELAAAGQSVCATLDTKEVKHQAIGYHPAAMNFEGQKFAGGGYYCVRK